MADVDAWTPSRTARTAGALYLIVVLTGIFGLAYVPSQLSVSGDLAATIAKIEANEPLYRLGIAAAFACYTAFLLLPLALYRLLAPFGRGAAVTMVAFVLASVPISFASQVYKLDVLSLLSGADYARLLTTEQLHAQVRVAMDGFRNGMLVANVFWGLWLLPFGWLVLRSGFLPRVLGVLLVLGCFGYLVDVLGTLLVPAYIGSTLESWVSLPGTVGEIGICLWLVVFGVRERERPLAAGAQAG